MEISMNKLTVKIAPGEVWYGPSTKHGLSQPHDAESNYSADIETSASCNQDNPLLLSNKGRFIYAPLGFKLEISQGVINVSSRFCEIDFYEDGETLRGAYLEASKRYFSPKGGIPPEEFFTIPQYNTWIELIYDQNQRDVLKYAHGIIDNGMPAGILMIDDGWNDYYGQFEFAVSKFPDPAAMCDELHSLGFKVMMWICPFVSPDSPEYRELSERGCLIRECVGDVERTVVREWWNGYSAVLDLTNPETVEWLEGRLRLLMEKYGIDGFKLDAGDAIYYSENDITNEKVTPAEHAALWNRFGLKFAYNEFRACFGCAGLPLVQRLHDKAHSWEDGVGAIVPDTLTQSLMGYAYTCPDMIGGGSFKDFLPGSTTFDPELLVRYCEASALMPMMQFSLAPWRVLDEERYATVLRMAELHRSMAPRIIELAREAALTGEPIVRHLEYVFPGEGFERVFDEFMLGDDMLVAPVYRKGEFSREVKLPSGEWEDELGVRYTGGTSVTVDAPESRLPYFVKIK